jgi:hypothetical protein
MPKWKDVAKNPIKAVGKILKQANISSDGKAPPPPASAKAPAPVEKQEVKPAATLEAAKQEVKVVAAAEAPKQQVEVGSAELAARMMAADAEQVLVADPDMDADYVMFM